jgi:hypothetical protein
MAFWSDRRAGKSTPPPSHIGGDPAALSFLASIGVGAATMILIRIVVGPGVLGEALGFFGMWAAIFPFARRTWAAGVPALNYWSIAVIATALGAALRLLTH